MHLVVHALTCTDASKERHIISLSTACPCAVDLLSLASRQFLCAGKGSATVHCSCRIPHSSTAIKTAYLHACLQSIAFSLQATSGSVWCMTCVCNAHGKSCRCGAAGLSLMARLICKLWTATAPYAPSGATRMLLYQPQRCVSSRALTICRSTGCANAAAPAPCIQAVHV